MPIQGKSELCEVQKKHFTDFQGISGRSLFQRYPSAINKLNKIIELKYQSFIAYPEENINDGTIRFYGDKYNNDKPEILDNLSGEKFEKYDRIKNETLAYFNDLVESYRNSNDKEVFEFLSGMIKHVDSRFAYCYDDKVVLCAWGMCLSQNIKEDISVIRKNLVKKYAEPTDPPVEGEGNNINGEEGIIKDEGKEECEDQGEGEEEKFYSIVFNAGSKGKLKGARNVKKNENELLRGEDIPQVTPETGFKFAGWDENPYGHQVTTDKEFRALYEPIDSVDPLTWFEKFQGIFSELFLGRNCLKWLLWLLLLLLFLLLLSWLIKGCNDEIIHPIPADIKEKPWVKEDSLNGARGGIYNPGNPYKAVPTPEEYKDILPPVQGLLPPMDTSSIIREPGNPVVMGNVINILMLNEDKSIMEFARSFKTKYPQDKYKVTYYDDVVKRIQVEVPPEEKNDLKNKIPELFKPEFEVFVFDEALFEAQATPNDPILDDQKKSWYLDAVNAREAWNITKGSPKVTVAIIDNGFNLDHPELKSKVVMPYNVWSKSIKIIPQNIDHGTHVAGIALAKANNGMGMCGLAPECAFMPVQVANENGIITTTSLLDGILYALYQGADVINVSLGLMFTGQLPENEQLNYQFTRFKEEERLWNQVMKIAIKHNAIVVVAAGNDNMLAGINPLNRPKNFIVTSALANHANTLVKADFSNFGNYSVISAPGVDIYSTTGSQSWEYMIGTSMAAPIITGAVALMKSLKDDLTAEQIICVLKKTGKPIADNIGKLVQIDKALMSVQKGEYSTCNIPPPTPTTGDIQILLSWQNYNDLDLMCIDPNGERIFFRNQISSSGGLLEIDMNVDYPGNKSPIENIFWANGTAPKGKYSVYVLHYKQHEMEKQKTNFTVKIKNGRVTKEYSDLIGNEGSIVHICDFEKRY